MRAFEIQLHKAIRESVLRFDSSVVTILKQYKELAERLGCTEDIDYAKTELEGYSLESVMFREVGCYSNFFSPLVLFPDYRKIKGPVVVGCATNSFYPQKQVPIENPEILNQIGVRGGIWCCTKAIVEYEELLKVPVEKVTLLEVPSIDGWGGRMINVKILCGRGELSKMISSVKEEVRRRLVRIEKHYTELKEEKSVQPNIAFNISGDNNQITTSGRDINIHSVTQNNMVSTGNGDWAAVERVLLEQKISKEDIADLRQALIDEPELRANATKEKPVFGEKVSGWLGGIFKKVLDGVYNIGTDVVARLLTQVIARYYGL